MGDGGGGDGPSGILPSLICVQDSSPEGGSDTVVLAQIAHLLCPLALPSQPTGS